MKGDTGHGKASWGTKPIALSAKSAMVLISWGIPLVMFLRLKLSFHAWTNKGIGWFRKHIHIGDRNSLNDTKGWYSFFWGGDLVFPKLRLHMCDTIAQNASSCESGRAWYSETDWIFSASEFTVYENVIPKLRVV